MKKEILISGMSCNHCAKKVEDALISIEGVEKVKVDLNKKMAKIKCNKEIDNNLIKEIITNLGYEVVGIN